MGLALLATSIGGLGGNTNTLPSAPAQEASVSVEARAMTTEDYVRNYFSDIPVMVEIAKCESRFRQHNENGEVLRGTVNPLDRGVMQVNEYYHGTEAKKLGFNILTLEGNVAYARYIFERQGVRPWKSSAPCWSKTIAYNNFINNRYE